MDGASRHAHQSGSTAREAKCFGQDDLLERCQATAFDALQECMDSQNPGLWVYEALLSNKS